MSKSILKTIKSIQSQRGKTLEPTKSLTKSLTKEEVFRKLDSFNLSYIEQYLRIKKLKNLDE